MLNRWATILIRRARAVLVVGVLAVIGAAAVGLGVFDHLGQGGFDDPATDSAKELKAEQHLFGNQNVDLVAIYRSRDLTVSDPRFRAEVEQTLAGLPKGSTTAVATYWTTHDAGLVSTDRHATQVLVSLAGKDQAATARINDDVMPALHADAAGFSTQVAGPWAVYKGVNETVSKDLEHAELLSMPLVVILSLLIFGSVVAALMPGVVGLIAMVGGLAVVRLLTTFTEVSVFSINVISLLGMGLAIDYALFVISRFREELAGLAVDNSRGRGDREAAAIALRNTLATAGRTVLFSGLTVAAAMSSLLVFPQNFLRSLGYGGVAAVLVAVVAALTVLPAILLLLGRRIDAGRMPWRRGRTVGVDGDHGAWARLAHGVMRRPAVVMVAIVVGLLAIATPFLGVKWGSVDYRVLPPSQAAHQAAVSLNEDFGGERSTANVLVPTTDAGVLSSYARALGEVDGVLGVQQVRQGNGSTLLRAAWPGNTQSGHSQQVLRELRAVPAPDGTLVGGMTANTVDLGRSIKHHLPWMAGIIVAVMLVLLFLAFGSVVLPLKAVAMNLLSLGAAFGVVTWIFADGHLEGALDYTSTGFLDMTQPIFMLAILVGLSMDYEVFLLSRVREQWDRSADNAASVAVGVQKTGRIITSAALLLAVVIGAFSLSGVVFMKMIGVGMLVALLVDATIVRALLVPATMKLLGRWNWWAPGPLVRVWERYGVRESGPEPVLAEADDTGDDERQPFARRLQDAVR